MFARWLIALPILLYRYTISPLLGPTCRYAPSCADYTEQAVRRYGLWYGGWMGTARICRCHPLGGAGYDPVPDLPPSPKWYRPWSYCRWRGPNWDEAPPPAP